MRSVQQEQAGQKTWRSGAFLAHRLRRTLPHFSDCTSCLRPVPFHRGRCAKRWHDGKLATSSVSLWEDVCRCVRYNKEVAWDIPKCYITKSGQEPMI